VYLLRKALQAEGPEWDDVRERLKTEGEIVGDLAEQTIIDSMSQRLDLGIASSNARWYLDRKHPDRGFCKRSEVKIEGGDNPLKVQTIIPIHELNLPLKVKRQVLHAMREYDTARKAAEEGAV